MSLITANYNGAVYTYQPMLKIIRVDPPWGGTPIEFPVPSARQVMQHWPDTADPLRTFWQKVCGYDFDTNFLKY